MIGYYVTQYGNTNSEALGVSRKPVSFKMAGLEGNTGEFTEHRLMYLFHHILMQCSHGLNIEDVCFTML